MNTIQTLPDIAPELRRPARYDYADCRHYQRVFEDDPNEPDGKSRTVYTCVDCRKVRTMKVWQG